MKKLLTLTLLAAMSQVSAFGQWAVIDVAALQQSIMNYAAFTKQIAHQATQIENQIQQIQQFETQLERMGDMASIRRLVGFREFRVDLNLPTQVKKWADNLVQVNGRGLFGDTRGGIFPEIKVQFPDFDGLQLDRDPEVFKQSHDIVVAVDEFKTVQSDIYTRRENMKRAIAQTSEAMQAATTEAEQQKLDAVINAQYGQLAAIDDEIEFSAAEVQVKAVEAAAMSNAQAEADAEVRRRLAQQEVTKISTAFTPTYECMLQYVTEKRFSP